MDNDDKKLLKELVEDYWVDNVLEQVAIIMLEKASDWADMGLPSDSVKHCTMWSEEIEAFLERMRNYQRQL